MVLNTTEIFIPYFTCKYPSIDKSPNPPFPKFIQINPISWDGCYAEQIPEMRQKIKLKKKTPGCPTAFSSSPKVIFLFLCVYIYIYQPVKPVTMADPLFIPNKTSFDGKRGKKINKSILTSKLKPHVNKSGI